MKFEKTPTKESKLEAYTKQFKDIREKVERGGFNIENEEWYIEHRKNILSQYDELDKKYPNIWEVREPQGGLPYNFVSLRSPKKPKAQKSKDELIRIKRLEEYNRERSKIGASTIHPWTEERKSFKAEITNSFEIDSPEDLNRALNAWYNGFMMDEESPHYVFNEDWNWGFTSILVMGEIINTYAESDPAYRPVMLKFIEEAIRLIDPQGGYDEEDLQEAVYAVPYTLLEKYGKYATEEFVDTIIDLARKSGYRLSRSAWHAIYPHSEYATKLILEEYNKLLGQPYDDTNEEEVENRNNQIYYLQVLLEQLAFGGHETSYDFYESLYYESDFDPEKDLFFISISDSGDVGIINKNGHLDRYFNLGDRGYSTEDYGPVNKISRQITVETFFSRIEELSEEEQKDYEQLVETFKIEYLPFYAEYPVEQLGAELANCSIREQMFFFKVFSESSEEERRKLLNTIKEGGEDAFRTICILSANDQEKTYLSLVDSIDPNTKKLVHYQIANLSRLIAKIDRQLITYFATEEVDIRSKNQTIREIEKKAARLFTKFLYSIDESALDDFLQELKQVTSQAILFGSICKSRQLLGELKFDEIAETKLEVNSASDLKEEEKNTLYSLFKRTRKGVYPEELIEKDLDGFKKRINNHGDKTDVYQLKYQDNLIAFMRFDHEKDGSIHAASLNNSPDADKAGIGMALLGQALKEASKKHVVKSEVNIIPSLINTYINEMDFVIYGVDVDTEDGETLFLMKIDTENVESLAEKQTTHEMITLDIKNQTDLAWIQNELAEELAQGAFIREVVRSSENKDEITIRLEKIAQAVALAA